MSFLLHVSSFTPPNAKKAYLGLFRQFTTSLSKVGHLCLSDALFQLLGGVERKVHNASHDLVDGPVQGLSVPLVDQGVQQEQLRDVVVGDAASQLVARLDDTRLGVLVRDAEVCDAGLEGGLGGGFAGGQVVCDSVFGHCSGDGEGVALVLEVFELGLDDAIEFLFQIGQEVLQDC